jgi:hypothetical protein
MGYVHYLEDRIRKSIKSDLNVEAPTGADFEALTAFLGSLPPPPRPPRAHRAGDAATARLRGLRPEIRTGEKTGAAGPV